ncbi:MULTISPECIES: dTDP-4-dehydrorhamnose 3,5-epimerase family protein [unclassified Methylophaga]|jgi:dTDP-4-dehydrorhamnose 3,5-epimerase|uniref:dTDP-4-dehydrorhamnose 3,5-epimerase family protein n=2 Tax=unclassified Methylophaga TaxID=2629249 RepID=UPI0023B65ADB|nr:MULTISPECIES: dTDP-4-dehydrorhamnose 3,5-epimerase family protein [unclassified Methylophaga]MDX1749560.1 dTDP-4-dehydrorhamnose 3,5-epimerase family protein [Methylophaga sp.]|tara:strand:- start:1898 stop:2455 length:558 start_codon:yes stop_codon:yes gene_type:complete
MTMQWISLDIADAFVIKQTSFTDQRGEFSRLFCQKILAPILGQREIKQVNFSRTTTRGTVRGLHYQRSPEAEMKFIRCIQGAVWDVMVDLRPDSPTFLQWHAEELSQENDTMIVIPEGCAHGFQALAAESELIYFHTAFYSATAEAGVHVQDPDLAIDWPLPVNNLSVRDSELPTVAKWLKDLSG